LKLAQKKTTQTQTITWALLKASQNYLWGKNEKEKEHNFTRPKSNSNPNDRKKGKCGTKLQNRISETQEFPLGIGLKFSNRLVLHPPSLKYREIYVLPRMIKQMIYFLLQFLT